MNDPLEMLSRLSRPQPSVELLRRVRTRAHAELGRERPRSGRLEAVVGWAVACVCLLQALWTIEFLNQLH